MDVDWQLRETGPPDAPHTVLLLPGGLCSAGSFAEVMASPALAGTRLVAATLPGHAGAPPLDDCSIENNARLYAALARKVGADVVVGFSMGASVALEMIASREFAGPAVLLGISLSAADEPAFFRAIVRLGGVLGALPAAFLAKAASSMVKRTDVSAERQAELRQDFANNDSGNVRVALREYVAWLHRHDNPAQRLCEPGQPVWIVHAEKGDGGLTDDERHELEACANVHLVTLPGDAFFLPIERPEPVAEAIREATRAAAPASAS
jgi:pimeloyl-ACP methyl ester carboxylesterase